MRFITNLDKNQYIDFFNNSKYSSILQSYEWGQFCIEGKGEKPYYVGLVNNQNKIVAATLLLKHPLAFGYSYFYAPRGFNMDFNDYDILNTFTKELKQFMKQEKVIYLKMDPEISYQELDNNANIIKNENNNYEIHKTLVNLGYIHNGFNKLYENNQPRYTFILDLVDDYKNRMSKSFLKNIEKSKKFNLEFSVGNKDDLKHFNRLYDITSKRDDFNSYGDKYYERFYDIFHEQEMAEIFICKLKPKKVLNALETELRSINEDIIITKNDNKLNTLHNRQEKVLKDMELYSKYKDEKEIVVSAHIMALYQEKAVALYAGNDKEFQSTYANNFMYYKKIEWAKKNDYKTLDLFGVTGDPNTKYKNLAGIFEFKKSLGGKLIEYIGEYDLVNNYVLYYSLKILLPIYHIIKKLITK